MIFLLRVSAYSDRLQGGVVGINLGNHSLFIPKESAPGINRIGSWVGSQRYICCSSCELEWRETDTKHSTLSFSLFVSARSSSKGRVER